jgi:hypothetical protein
VKILCIAGGIPTNDAKWVRIYNINKALSMRGHDTLLAILSTKIPKALYLRKPVDAIILQANALNAISLLRDIIHKHDPDVVIGHTHRNAFLALASTLDRVPVVYDMHGLVYWEMNLSGITTTSMAHGLIEMLSTKMSRFVLVVSAHT